MKKKKSGNPQQINLLDEIQKVTQKFTTEQETFIFSKTKKSIILRACAGSGKTFSCIHRLKELLRRGVDPSRIIFFSFTNTAVDELKKRVENDEIKITTIHSFCTHILHKIGKFKKITNFYEFLDWYKEKNKPKSFATSSEKEEFSLLISEMYDEAEFIASSISAFKLQSADGGKCMVPPYLSDYVAFQRETRSRDFSDMLIEVRDILKEEKYLNMFKDKYDYIFCDEYQDTSALQLQILLALNAKFYYLVGDVNQALYGYAGSNSNRIEEMLKKRRETEEMSLSVNFRSDKIIVENSNKYSSLKAIPSSIKEGFVNKNVILRIDELIELFELHSELAVLVRTNKVIKKMEIQLLKHKVPIKYFNFITPEDINNYRKGEVSYSLKNKFSQVKDYFGSDADVVSFIESNKSSSKFIGSIHKSKGKEWDFCVLCNCISSEILVETGLCNVLGKKRIDRISFSEDDNESRFVHYVGVSRAKHGLYYMIYE